jgi:O-antigen ligase
MTVLFKKLTSNYTLDELIVLGLALSIFVSIYFTIAAILMTLGYMIMQDRIRPLFISVRRAYWLLAFCASSLVVSMLYQNFTGMLIAFAMSVIFLIAMFVRTVMTRELFEKIIDLCIWASVYCFAVAIFQQLLHVGEDYRADSTFFNANYYATIIEFAVLFCVYRLFGGGASIRKKVFLSAVILMNIFGLYLCDCRSAFIVLGVAVPVMMILMKKLKELFILLCAGVAAVAALYLIPDLFPRVDQLDGDFAIRLRIWKTAVKGILENPLFGQGGGTYANIYSKFNGHPAPHAHNLLLDPLLNFGIAGFALLLKYLKTNLTAILRLNRVKQDQGRFHLAAAVVTCVAVHGMFDITVFGLQTGLLLMVFLGLAGVSEYAPEPYRVSAYQTLIALREGQKASSLSFLNIKKP